MKLFDGLKVKHLDYFGDEIDAGSITREIFGIKSLFNKSSDFIKDYTKKLKAYVLAFSSIDIEEVELDENFWLKKPRSFNDLTFVAVMELESLFNSKVKLSQSDFISRFLAICCFSENNDEDFDLSKDYHSKFIEKIMDSNAIQCMKLMNLLLKDYKESQENWNKLFSEVSLEDPDYSTAGGSMLDRFKVVRSVKMICNEFNLNYYEAWQLPYGVFMASSLESATSNYVQRNLTKIKEDKMRRAQKR